MDSSRDWIMEVSALLTAVLHNRRLAAVKRVGLWLRGLLFLGWRFRCPCCAWSLRGFVGRNGLWKSNVDGYCPRCNAKARHRRHCIFLSESDLLSGPSIQLLEIAPWRALSTWLRSRPNLDYIGLDRRYVGSHINLVGDAVAIPLAAASCDVVLCIHVLEHVEDDGMAISEIFRVVRPGGTAIVSVPLQFDGPTREDPAITDPADRKRLFGEEDHVRFYGTDLIDRLQTAGFAVEFDNVGDIADETCRRYGLRRDENIFICRKSA
jgi:hypothetical protein